MEQMKKTLISSQYVYACKIIFNAERKNNNEYNRATQK